MPNSVVQSFAKKSGKSEAEVEKMWNSVKKSLLDQGKSEKDDNFYSLLTGILKKNLKLEQIEEIENALYQNFLREKDDKQVKGLDIKAKTKDDDDKTDQDKQDDDDEDHAVLDGDYSSAEMLRAVIETIRYTDDPEGEAGAEGEIDFGLEILYEIADQIPEDTAEVVIDALFQFYDISDEDVDDNLDSDDDEEETDESLNEQMVSEISMVKKKRLYYLKQKRKRQLGKRAGSMQFKRSYKFDTKKGRYVKRKKAQSVQQIRKKARLMKRQNKRGGTKVRQQRTKRRVKHVKDPYGGGKKKK